MTRLPKESYERIDAECAQLIRDAKLTPNELECLARIAWCHIRHSADYRDRPFGGLGESVQLALDKAGRLLASEEHNREAKRSYKATRAEERERREARFTEEPERRAVYRSLVRAGRTT
jgi:hypothetical protein